MSSVSVQRLANVGVDEDLDNLNPILGVENAPVLSIEDALASAQSASLLTNEQTATVVYCAKKHVKREAKKSGGLCGLTANEASAMHVYTQETPLHRQLNTLLRSRDRTQLKVFFPHLKLLLTAIHKLPPCDATVCRGVPGVDFSSKYVEGRDVMWWGFTSATAKVDVLQNEMFLGTTGLRTMFNLRVSTARDITRFSAIGVEHERLLLPGTAFEVVSALKAGHGLTIIQMEQDHGAPPMIHFGEVPVSHHLHQPQQDADTQPSKTASSASGHGGSTSASDGWNCSSCTFLNSSENTHCRMCATPANQEVSTTAFKPQATLKPQRTTKRLFKSSAPKHSPSKPSAVKAPSAPKTPRPLNQQEQDFLAKHNLKLTDTKWKFDSKGMTDKDCPVVAAADTPSPANFNSKVAFRNRSRRKKGIGTHTAEQKLRFQKAQESPLIAELLKRTGNLTCLV